MALAMSLAEALALAINESHLLLEHVAKPEEDDEQTKDDIVARILDCLSPHSDLQWPRLGKPSGPSAQHLMA